MTKAAAMCEFWSSFGLPAYEENSVPAGDEAPAFPYLTYTFIVGDNNEQVNINVSLWYRSTSWVRANAKADEIAKGIKERGALPFDGGGIRLWKGTPFQQDMADEEDDQIKRVYLNVTAEYIII